VLAAAVCAATAAAAETAVASDDPAPDTVTGIVRVTPEEAKPGEEVDLRVGFCQESGLVSSDVFTHDVELRPAADGGLFAEAVIRRDARPGRYEITVTCDPDAPDGEGTITVVDGRGRHHGGHHGGHHGRDGHRLPPPAPIAPVHAGGGGTAAGEGGGMSASGAAGLAVAGGAAVLGAAVAVARRRRADGHAGR
jgi:hypothetical protein